MLRQGRLHPRPIRSCDRDHHRARPGQGITTVGTAAAARLDGAYSRVGDEDTAFSGGRSPRYAAFIVGLAPDDGPLAADRAWVRSLWEALRPHAIDGADGYINSMSEYSGDGVRSSYGAAKYQRLASIKAKRSTTPGNVFHLNANIPPG